MNGWRLFWKSVSYAYEGFTYTIQSQRNMRIHIFFAWFVNLLLLIMQSTLMEILLVMVVIAVVMACELLNTAIEAAIDLVTEEIHPLAKQAKDAAAAAVLCIAYFALLIGIGIFLPNLLHGHFRNWNFQTLSDISFWLIIVQLIWFTYVIGKMILGSTKGRVSDGK